MDRDIEAEYERHREDRPTRAGDTRPDLEAISEKWLQVCPVCDGGLPSICTHPDEDYRPVMLELVREIERLRRIVNTAYREDSGLATWADELIAEELEVRYQARLDQDA